MWGTRVRDHDFERQMSLLNSEAGAARERAGELEERAEKLAKEAEQARLEQEKLKQQLAWRRLTKDQFDTLVTKLQANPGQISISYLSDPESSVFGREIVTAFRNAGWQVEESSEIIAGSPPFGLFVKIEKAPPIPFVAKALNDIGLPVTVEQGHPHGTFALLVGAKPPPV
jgi:hypothetical protein